ncbi:hypothetical protein F7725_016809 [Dissostichus mawsoni]|uniref:VPS10 domain-containing protein n=1 Tax=Dissostichus mawsoni TaxID=36200 RepID=A0A7J5Z3B4_DISMA|nr:hypothetical protein F7725_016809 [Dissostichus mawsoni]
MAQLPTVNHEQFYSILASNQDMIFMHTQVLEPSMCQMTEELFSPKSLERHLYTTTGSETDFTAISSLRGVYMTSVLSEDGAMETVITFDQGAKWQTLRRPQNSHCDTETSTNRPNRCRLLIHAAYSITMMMNVPMLPLSQSSAVGIILAHGSVGDEVSSLSPDVYVSDDGGYSWMLALRGPHHYAIMDSGGLLMAVEQTNAPRPAPFSGFHGQRAGGSRSMNVSLWGYRNDFSKWVVITIDFRKILTRDCEYGQNEGTEGDYVQWLAHSADPSGSHDGCVLGYKETFLRLRKDSVLLEREGLCRH